MYLNIPEYHAISKFISELRTNKSDKALSVPKEVFTVLSKCNDIASAQHTKINQQLINVPLIKLTLPKKLSRKQLKGSVSKKVLAV